MNQSPRLIFDYLDYREFLRDRFCSLKAGKKTFSYRSFSKRVGISASLITMVLRGNRSLTKQNCTKVARGLNLNKPEAEFFALLVKLDRSESDTQKEILLQQIFGMKTFYSVPPLREDQSDYIRKWYYVAIREMLLISGGKATLDWICQHIVPRISRNQAQEALGVLTALDLVKESGGKYFAIDQNVSGKRISAKSWNLLHGQMIALGRNSLDLIPKKDRHVGAITIAIRREMLNSFSQKIDDFLRTMFEENERGRQSRDQVYQLNVQFFPLTKKVESIDHGP